MLTRAKAMAGVAGLAVAVSIPLGLTQGGGSVDVFVGSTPTPVATATPITCNQTATNAAGLATAVTAATTGQNVCLTTNADYGTWTGTSKAITLIAQSATGARSPTSPTLTIAFGSGDTGFTIDGNMSTWAAGKDSGEGMMLLGSGSSPVITTGASNITLKNFRSSNPGSNRTWNMDPAPTSSNILIDHAVFYNETGGEATFYIWCSGSCDTGITIQNTLQIHSSTDFFKLSNDSKVTVKNNKCIDSHEANGAANHTDCLQFNSGSGSVVRGNWFWDADQCISGFDGQDTASISHNVVGDCDGHAITLMKDTPASTVEFNTVLAGGEDSIICGNGTGKGPTASVTNLRNNIAGDISLIGTEATCVPTVNTNNMCPGGCGASNINGSPTFVGGATPSSFTSFAMFCLSALSSGYTGASDGGQVGVCGGNYSSSTDGPPSVTREGY